MIHRPKLSANGDVDQIKSDLKALEITTADYKTSYALKFGKTEDQIEAMFQKGDYWMDAKEAKDIGLLDVILGEPMAITSEDVERLVACGHPNPPKMSTNTEHTMKNRNQIIAALKLSADATDEQIEQAVKDAQAKADQVESITASQKAALVQDAKDFAAKAIVDKKITADVSEKWQTAYERDPEGTKAMMAAMPSVKKPSDSFTPGDEPTATGRDKWTMQDYQDKDPQALSKMMVDEPEKFEKLQSEYFGK